MEMLTCYLGSDIFEINIVCKLFSNSSTSMRFFCYGLDFDLSATSLSKMNAQSRIHQENL